MVALEEERKPWLEGYKFTTQLCGSKF